MKCQRREWHQPGPAYRSGRHDASTLGSTRRVGAGRCLYEAGLCLDFAVIGAGWTPEIAAVVVVHTGGGLTSKLARIRSWCDERDVLLIEDAARRDRLGPVVRRHAHRNVDSVAGGELVSAGVGLGGVAGVVREDAGVHDPAPQRRYEGKDDHGGVSSR